MKKIMFARQPVFDSDQKTCAYELLYRDDMTDIGNHTITTSELSDTLNDLATNMVANGCLVFVNLPGQGLFDEFPMSFPTDRTVLGIKEDIPVDGDMIASIKRLKSKGFAIALDNFTSVHPELLSHADFVKVDILTYQDKLEAWVHKFRDFPVKLVANNVETHDQQVICNKLGFDFFQGQFFCKPLAISDHHSLNPDKAQSLQLLNRSLAAKSPKELEYDIAHDLALSYKLLRYINSASIGLRRQVDSIGHALTLMGLNRLRMWVSMLLMSSLSTGKAGELLNLSFCRGRFLEQLAISQKNNLQSNDYFILGMFSLLDALLNQNINQAVEPAALPQLVQDGLFNHSSEPAIRLNIIQAMEKGDWNKLESLLSSVELDHDEIASIYMEAIQWSDEKKSLINSMS